MSVDTPEPLPPTATPRETAIWCANLLAQCVHNWNVAQSWFETFSAQIKNLEQRMGAQEEIPVHREQMASVHDIQEMTERIEHVVEGNRGALNSERVREITTDTITRKGYDDLSLAARERKQFYLSVLLAVIAAGLGVLGGRLLPH